MRLDFDTTTHDAPARAILMFLTCIKRGARIQYLVDGKVVRDVSDDGDFGGKPLDGGAIGFRNFGKGTQVLYDNVTVRDVEKP